MLLTELVDADVQLEEPDTFSDFHDDVKVREFVQTKVKLNPLFVTLKLLEDRVVKFKCGH